MSNFLQRLGAVFDPLGAESLRNANAQEQQNLAMQQVQPLLQSGNIEGALTQLAGTNPEYMKYLVQFKASQNKDPLLALQEKKLQMEIDDRQSENDFMEGFKNRGGGMTSQSQPLPTSQAPTASNPYQSGNVPLSIRNNNPLNLRAVGSNKGFRTFINPQDGIEAGDNDLLQKITGNSTAMRRNFGADYVPSLKNLISTFAPPTENDTNSYIQYVAEKTGIDPNQPLKPENVPAIRNAMIGREGGAEAVDYFSPNIDNAKPMFKPVPATSNGEYLDVPPAQGGNENAQTPVNRLAEKYPNLAYYDELIKYATETGRIKEAKRLSDIQRQDTQYINYREDKKLEGELNKAKPKVTSALQAMAEEASRSQQLVDKMLYKMNVEPHIGNYTGSIVSKLPSLTQKSADFDALLETVKGDKFLNTIQSMKEASPTGSMGTGPLSDSEGKRIQAAKANVDASQSPEQFQENLKIYQSTVKSALDRFTRQYNESYGTNFTAEDLMQKQNNSNVKSSVPKKEYHFDNQGNMINDN